MPTFKYVKIPAESTEAIEELLASKEGGLEQDALIRSAKSYFHKQAKKEDHPSCEIMSLSIPLPGNNYRTVSMYVGDYGHDSRENQRATQLGSWRG